jgi:hypothetical protein
MKTKTNYLNLNYVLIFLYIICSGILFISCSKISIPQVTAVDSSVYKLSIETQIQIYPYTISGEVFYDYCQHSNYLYFTFFKHSNKYKIKGYALNSALITPMAISKKLPSQTIPSIIDSPFTMRGEVISIVALNSFFDSLYTIDHFDFRNHPASYNINIEPDPYIQSDSLGRYFDIEISASPKDSLNFTSSTKGKLNPCPKCYTIY